MGFSLSGGSNGSAGVLTPSVSNHIISIIAIMKKSLLSLSLALLGVGTLATSCEDMLTPDMDRYAVDFSGKDTVNFYLGILSNMQGMVEQNVLLGELRGDLVKPTEYVSDSINGIINFSNLTDGDNALLNRAAYYKVINQCNFYLAKVDSTVMKNNNYYMRRELAQVQLVRAWTYMQLVQNYGRVPFIVKPVDNAGTGWETNPDDWATPDNLLDLLESKGNLRQAYAYSEAYGYPKYGKFNNGRMEFDHSMLTFNADIIYGDLHLLRGQAGKNDYAEAAKHYHKYLDEDNNDYVSDYATASLTITRGVEKYSGFAFTWGRTVVGANSYTSPSEIRTVVPSASNNFFGTMLTRIPQIYGFDATSKNATSSSTSTVDGKEKETVTTTGEIKLLPNYRHRQVEPSVAMDRLSAAQTFVFNEGDFSSSRQKDVKYLAIGDRRLAAAAPIVQTTEGRYRFIQKFGSSNSYSDMTFVDPNSFTFRYGIPLYRTRTLYLRYAEALNRAGFPRYAFAILRDGLSPETLPTEGLTEKSDTIWADPETKTDIATIVKTSQLEAFPMPDGAKDIDLGSLIRSEGVSWLNFDRFASKENEGTRVAGAAAGFSKYQGFTDLDSVWVYEKVVAQRIVDEAARQGHNVSLEQASKAIARTETGDPVDYDPSGSEPTTGKTEAGDEYTIAYKLRPAKVFRPSAVEIAAMETIIADELALETAFEGQRYYDLMRLARHRNDAGEDGTSWMAWLISRRDLDLAPYQEPTKTGALFGKLSNMDNWYLPAPQND